MVYVYFDSYLEVLAHKEFNFSARFQISKVKGEMTFAVELLSFDKGFWGGGVSNVSVVVGKNGKGKTTLLEYLGSFNALYSHPLRSNNTTYIYWSSESDPGFLVLSNLENSPDKLPVRIIEKNNLNPLPFEIFDCSNSSEKQTQKIKKRIMDAYISGHFSPSSLTSYSQNELNYIPRVVSRGDRNYLIDLKEYLNSKILLHYNFICNYPELIPFELKDIYMSFSLNFYEGPLRSFSLSPKIQKIKEISESQGLQTSKILSLIQKIYGRLLEVEIEKKTFNELIFTISIIQWLKDKFLWYLETKNKEKNGYEDEYWEEILILLSDLRFEDIDLGIQQLKEIEGQTNCKAPFSEYLYALKAFIDNFGRIEFEYKSSTKELIYRFPPSKNEWENEPSRLIKILDSAFLKEIVFPFHIMIRGMSSGEEKLISLFGNILSEIEFFISEEKGHSKNLILLIDEGDLGFHPEWQRNYLKFLLDFINRYALKQNLVFQIVLATHSPFLLSDIPGRNVLYLESDRNGVLSSENTFAGNIHTLLANGFFMKSTIGAFAEEKIKRLIRELKDDLEEGEKREYTEESSRQLIEMVGEPLLQSLLQDLFDQKYSDLN